MLNKKATKLTKQIISVIQLPDTTHTFITLHPLILNLLIEIYLQGRKDQIDKVGFTFKEDGSLKFLV